MSIPLIHIISMGGTISMTKGERGVVPTLTAADLLESVPGIDKLAQIECTTLKTVASPNLTFDDLFDLRHAIKDALAMGAEGIVVTMGTDTMEEAAFAVEIILGTSKAVVFTGAMRNPTLPSNDGPGNLYSAVQAAASGYLNGLGVMVLMNDELHAASHVKKVHSSSLSAFQSPETGPVARIHEGKIIPMASFPATPLIDVKRDEKVPVVPVIECVMDGNEILLDGLSTDKIDGLIIAGFGGGRVSATMADKLEALAMEVPVVVTTRAGQGPVSQRTYGYPGGEIDLKKRGVFNSSWQPRKARLLLTFALMGGASREGLKRLFAA